MSLRHALPAPLKTMLRPFYRGFMRGLRLLVDGVLWVLSALLGPSRFLTVRHYLTANLDSTVTVAGIRFDGAEEIPFFRATSLLTKEPDTIAWLDEYVREGEVFYDIGANIGVYTLYAALKRRAQVVAFEPMAENFAIFCRNLYLNGLSGSVVPLNIALHDKTTLANLSISAMTPGKATHGFDTNVAGSDLATFTPQFRQPILGFRVDDIMRQFDLWFPNHIKIDVDGNDPLVLDGCGDILKDPRLRSVAIELNVGVRPKDAEVIQRLTGLGFRELTDPRYINHEYIRSGQSHNHFLIRD
ncbi:MAG: FkbM family methyltransferase [Phaeospirillum sp.]|nr:FkbM family methyltransferase [Phaeospirillum sp.]